MRARAMGAKSPAVQSNNKGDEAMAFGFETVPARRSRIDMSNPSELRYWSRKFGCNEQQLRQAVSAVGESSALVEQLLDGQELVSL